MKAAQLSSYGGKDALVVNIDVDKPVINENQVLVEVYSASANPFDYKLREGYLKDYVPLQFPATLGGDIAGKVVEVGASVNKIVIGDEVYGQANAVGKGSFAEYAAVNADQLAKKPRSIDFNQAAALPLAAISAYQAIIETIKLTSGQKILIQGGAGGIGSFAIQFAKNVGAYIATTANKNDEANLKALRADLVIDYEKEDFTNLINEYDAVFDTVGGEVNQKSYQVLKEGGYLVSMVDQPNEDLVNKYKIKYTSLQTKVTTEKLDYLSNLINQNKINISIAKVFPLDEAPEALEYLKVSHPKGKVVIKIK